MDWWKKRCVFPLLPLLLLANAFLFRTASQMIIPIHCTILSKRLDLRSSKICSYQHAWTNPLQRSKFQCYLDYYWASIFKVEFRPFSSNLPLQAVAEVPREALPAHCKPGFGAAWRIKEMYQINGTYLCKYTPGNLRSVTISEELFAECKAEKLSIMGLWREFWIELFFSEQSMFSVLSAAEVKFWHLVAAVLLGILWSMFVTGLSKIVRQAHIMVFEISRFSEVDVRYFDLRLHLTWMLVVFLFGAALYNIQYGSLDSYLNSFSSTLFRKSGLKKWLGYAHRFL